MDSAEARRTAGTVGLVTVVYEDLLGVTAQADDDFFDLGGHSMLAVLAMSELSEARGEELPVKLIFDHPTARGLAAAVDRHLATSA